MVRSLPSQEFLCLCFSASPATFFYKGNSDAERRSIPRKLKNLLFLILISELTYFSFYTLLLVGVLIRRIFIMMDLKTLLPDERILPLLPLPFFAMGYLMHRHQEQCLSVGDRFCLVVFAAGTVLTLAENCFQTHTLYIGTVLMVPSVLLLCVKHGEHVPQSWFGRMMSHIGSKTATYIYLFHILVETVLRVMINGVLPGIRENSLFATAYPLIVFAASAVFGEMIFRVKLLGKHLNTKT